MHCDILQRKKTNFLLWRPHNVDPSPGLVIGRLNSNNPSALADERYFDLKQSENKPDLWEISATDCGLVEGEIYYYWFEINNSNPYERTCSRILCTDPFALSVDWRILAPLPYSSGDKFNGYPAAVIKYKDGTIVPTDTCGEIVDWDDNLTLENLAPNNRLVIYELPIRWTSVEYIRTDAKLALDSFHDVSELIDFRCSPLGLTDTYRDQNRSYLNVLGVNAIELLPIADSFPHDGLGYTTSNYFAADWMLGYSNDDGCSSATSSLIELVNVCHKHGIRFYTDMVLAFGYRDPYQHINYPDFHVTYESGDPEEYNRGKKRNGWGGNLFKYNYLIDTYDPVSGEKRNLSPARQFMHAQLFHWAVDFRIDGFRIDSVENIGNWDFIQELKEHARHLWRERWRNKGCSPDDIEARFLVAGEEPAVPIDMLRQQRLDGLWNEDFKRMVRNAIVGRNDEKEPSFEWTIRKIIDCRLLGFQDGSQAINYITSHDIQGFQNERLYNYLINNGIVETEQRIKLAFACLLTAVGIPMIFAREECADMYDLPVRYSDKQAGKNVFTAINDEWRKRVFKYVAELVKLRTSHDALAVNNTKFIHSDFTEGKRVLVWQRGQENSNKLVVVVANFSDFTTPDALNGQAEYIVPNWPATPHGMYWREITLDREIPHEWVGREPIFAWEAKVYALMEY